MPVTADRRAVKVRIGIQLRVTTSVCPSANPLMAAAARASHVGWDRGLSYGLKLPSGSRDTHLGRIGRG